MADVPVGNKLLGLDISAPEWKELTGWPDSVIEEILNFFRNQLILAGEVDTKNNIIKNTTVVTFAGTPYTPLETDEEIFFDTTDGPIDCSLPPGIDGTNYRMINVGFAENVVNLIPALANKLFGVAANEVIYDSEVVLMTYDEDIESWY